MFVLHFSRNAAGRRPVHVESFAPSGAGGKGVEVLAGELPVQATSNGEMIGSLRVKILAEFALQRCAACCLVPDMGRETQRLELRHRDASKQANDSVPKSRPFQAVSGSRSCRYSHAMLARNFRTSRRRATSSVQLKATLLFKAA